MEFVKIKNLPQKICRVGLGTWAIGGSMWGGTDEKESVETILRALELGINFIDTAPVYGFGVSEKFVGKAIKAFGNRDALVIATKVGINWSEKKGPHRDSSKKRILQEIEHSLKRLQVEWIDLYQVHWPDLSTPFEEVAEVLLKLLEQGKIRAIGASNFDEKQMDALRKNIPVHSLQSPYNLFERNLDKSIIPYCRKNKISVLGYGPLCRGLLTGRMQKDTQFPKDDLRNLDPKFQQPRYAHYLLAVDALKKWAKEKYDKQLPTLAIRFVLDQGVDIALWGCRKQHQLETFSHLWNWKLTDEDKAEIETILQLVIDPVGPEFMAPAL